MEHDLFPSTRVHESNTMHSYESADAGAGAVENGCASPCLQAEECTRICRDTFEDVRQKLTNHKKTDKNS